MKRVITIGESMASLSPQNRELISYGASFDMRIAGAESNTAIGLQKLGHTTIFLTRLGDDPLGQFILRMIRAEGVDVSHIRIDPEHPTGIMIKEPLPGQTTAVYYYRSDSAASFMAPADIPEEIFDKDDILHFSGITPILSQSCRDTIFAALKVAKSRGCTVSFDPNIRRKLWKMRNHGPLMRTLAAKCDYLLIGREEAEVLYGTTDIDQIRSGVFTGSCVKFLAVKDGAQGAWVCDREQVIFIPPAKCRCVDPVGAGDAFNAGFLSGILEGRTLKECGTIAAIAGAKATESHGDIESLPSRRDLDNILQQSTVILR